jgi:hypothetical protein
MNISKLKIDVPEITIIASGTSINTIPKSFFEYMKSRSYVIGLNYSSCYFTEKELHAIWWSDINVSSWLDTYHTNKPNLVLISREEAFLVNHFTKLYDWVDYFFNTDESNINYTIAWVLQNVRKLNPLSTINIFGLDGYGNGKWYDTYISWDEHRRGKTYNIQKNIQQSFNNIIKTISPKNIINYNIHSTLDYFSKRDWKELENEYITFIK